MTNDPLLNAYTDLESRVTQALVIARECGQAEGDWHKAWVIDQMVKVLTGPLLYKDFVRSITHDANGEQIGEWYGGTPP